MLTRKDFMGAHEWCFYGWKEGAAHQFFGPNNATDLWSVKKVNPAEHDPFDREACRIGCRGPWSTRLEPGENVLDLFGGSGSTLDRRRADGTEGVPDGVGPAVLRRHRATLGEVHRQESGTTNGQAQAETVEAGT